ncbi:translation initiation factor IF-2 [Oceanivirga salmonicida]|uniref:translation initiation factor IF-2 n=1 Tax=Oceanivirga salmonicida TaxID=1769291 RepID=UPI0018CC4535|nr:translation initiation factor IF-2 [Oceanivirga salmonicida]
MGNRIYDVAKKFGMDTIKFVEKISKLGITKNNPLNKLDENEMKKIEMEFQGKNDDNVVVKEKMIFSNTKKEKKNYNKDSNWNNNRNKVNTNKTTTSTEDNAEKPVQKDYRRNRGAASYTNTNSDYANSRKNFDNKKENNWNNRNRNNNTGGNNNYRNNAGNNTSGNSGYRNNAGNNTGTNNYRSDNRNFKSFDKDKEDDDSTKKFGRPKPKKRDAKPVTDSVIPESENGAVSKKFSKASNKSKFDKKKYEKEKKAKEEARKLKELRTDFRKDVNKKKVKKKDKEIKSEIVQIDEGAGVLKIVGELTVKELGKKLGVNSSDIIKKFFMEGKILTANAILSLEEIEELALEYDVLIEHEEPEEISYGEKYELEEEDKEEDLELRAPVITIMGHVDHGKTSLLDALRHTNVIEGEAGGITQSIGAYQVKWKNQLITFIDTPGHEAFTEMRVRGANITDIAILIVAADDGVKPQTVEAISHAKEAGVPIIVAINKIDKVGANPMRVKQELMEHGLITQEWGGDIECVEISAKEKLNLEELLETIIITSELLELKANSKKRARAVIIESKLDPQVGTIADILIQEGELRIGDIFVAGESYGKIRTMIDDKGNKIEIATPSMPVEVTGFNNIPEAGDLLYCVKNDKQARKIIEDYRNTNKLNELNGKKHISLESLSKELEDKQLKELKCIIRADSKGSVEALKESLAKLSNDKVAITVIQASAGAITEGDVKLAEASDAIIIGFGVRPNNTARNIAEKIGVEIRNYNVIYHVTEDIEKAIKGMLDPEYKEIYYGRLEVKKVFKVSNVGNIAGSLVVDGKVVKKSNIRLLRNGIIIHEGEIDSLKRYKDDVKEANLGQECGISIKDYTDIKEGDIIESFTMEEITR